MVSGDAAESVHALRWQDLKKDDRVRHFDYGDGTVRGAGPAYVYITWDNPNETVSHHDAAIVQYLTRI